MEFWDVFDFTYVNYTKLLIARGTRTINLSLKYLREAPDIAFNTAYAISKAAMIKFHQDLDA